MYEIKTVADFLKHMPVELKHESVYLDKMRRASVDDIHAPVNIDLAEWELATMSIGELNILKDLICPEKFVLHGMDEKFVINADSVAKAPGMGTLRHKKDYPEGFRLDETLALRAGSAAFAIVPRGEGVQVPRNCLLYFEMMSALPWLSPLQGFNSVVLYVGEKMVFKQDLRHIFLKGYLTICSYNLAVSSGVTGLRMKNYTPKTMFGKKATDWLDDLMSCKIVVDVSNLTRDEVSFLSEIGDSYPLRRWGNSGNIYNNVCVGSDNLLFVSDNPNYKMTRLRRFSSPESLWQMLISIARKFQSLEDLRQVVKDIRGIPGLMRDVNLRTGLQEFILDYPPSYSVLLAMEYSWDSVGGETKFSNYFSTTKSLVADLMLSNMMIMSGYNLIENLGFQSVIGCCTEKPATDEYFNSNLRNRCLRSVDEQKNELLMEWMGVKENPIVLGFSGKLVDYAAKLAASLVDKQYDMIRPALLHSLPYSMYKNTTWATIRGYRHYAFLDFSRTRVLEMETMVAQAYSWVMGVTEVLPKVGLNAIGQTNLTLSEPASMDFLQCAKGEYLITRVQHFVKGNLKPRLDEKELGDAAFYNSNFPGIYCTIIFDRSGKEELLYEEK